MLLFPSPNIGGLSALFTLSCTLMLALDLGVFIAQGNEVSFKEASIWSVVWVTFSLFFIHSLPLPHFGNFAGRKTAGVPGFDPTSPPGTCRLISDGIHRREVAFGRQYFIFVMVFRVFRDTHEYQHRSSFTASRALSFARLYRDGFGLMQCNWVITLRRLSYIRA